MKLTGIRIAHMSLSLLAAQKAVLGGIEKELGVALVDLGGGSTGVAIFSSGGLVDMAVLPVGGEHITRDLAIALRTSFATAEKIKCQVGLLKDSQVELPDAEKSNGRTLTAGVVLVGGGALLKGLRKVASEYFDMPVKVGVATIDGINLDSSWCGCVGLIRNVQK